MLNLLTYSLTRTNTEHTHAYTLTHTKHTYTHSLIHTVMHTRTHIHTSTPHAHSNPRSRSHTCMYAHTRRQINNHTPSLIYKYTQHGTILHCQKQLSSSILENDDLCDNSLVE